MLALLVVMLPWATWRFALRDTFEAWRDCRRLSEQLAATTSRTEAEQPLTDMASGVEIVLSGLLLDAVRQAATDRAVRVAGYEPLVTGTQDGIAVHTAQLTLTGDYTALLQVVAELERTLARCRLRSLKWTTATDRQARRTQLSLTLYIQQITLRSCFNL